MHLVDRYSGIDSIYQALREVDFGSGGAGHYIVG